MEEIKVTADKLLSTLKRLVREGNVRRVILRNPQGRILLDMPLAAGLAGALLLPFWATVATVVVMATDFTILVERDPDLPAR